MEQAARDGKPFFVAVGFRRPHAPYAAPQKYFDLYPVDSMRLPESPPPGYFEGLLQAAHNYGPPAKQLTPTDHRELIAAYYACISFVDAQVGVVLDALDRLDLWKNTIVVLFGDHGYHLGDHGGFWHKNSLFEESCRVPLIVYAPGMAAARKPCGQLVELVDLYPTLTSLCRLPTPDGLDGIDLSPLLDDPLAPSKDVAYSLIARSSQPEKSVTEVEYLGRSIRTDRWRYTEWDEGKKGVELYDHENDPHEWRNLAQKPEHAEIVRQMRQLLELE
jgi:uncharacterized sulfatase